MGSGFGGRGVEAVKEPEACWTSLPWSGAGGFKAEGSAASRRRTSRLWSEGPGSVDSIRVCCRFIVMSSIVKEVSPSMQISPGAGVRARVFEIPSLFYAKR
jgi:hypothetical protein